MEYVSNLLQQSPGHLISMITLRAQIVSLTFPLFSSWFSFVCGNNFFLFVCFPVVQNVNEQTIKRVLQYMRSAKFVEFYQCPLEDFDPSAGPCVNKKGTEGTKTLKHSMHVQNNKQ